MAEQPTMGDGAGHYLVQPVGPAARNVEGRVIMYAERIWDAMARTIEETERRRQKQTVDHVEHGITPQSMVRSLEDSMADLYESDDATSRSVKAERAKFRTKEDTYGEVARLEKELLQFAEMLQFEKAAELGDRILVIKSWSSNPKHWNCVSDDQ